MSIINPTELLFFQGIITFGVVSELLNKLEDIVLPLSIEKLRYKRLFSSAVEILENIQMHSIVNSDYPKPTFKLSLVNKEFRIESCNIMRNEDRENLEEKIHYLNKNLPNLSEMFSLNLMNRKLSEKGGAGLGLYIIRRNSAHEISFKTEGIDNDYAYFCISVLI
ncbi:MAG: DUF6272 family protein [Salinivirgaceae bacterium]|nr:DUF6272 family protein [Salinivirgaceae bacterium]MDY0278984.1 DUF6272 family protein [Salinivirgaceae bacterium]